jgi:ferric-dicitrate binding protein FerR (iron transport regulator)
VEAGPQEEKVVTLRGGSQIVLRPRSRLTYSYLPTLGKATPSMGSLEGEAAFTIDTTDRFVTLKTFAGSVMMTPGTYAVRCEPGCAALLVTVGVGVASIRADSTRPSLQLSSGEFGRVSKGGAPEKVTGGAGWPTLPTVVPR